MYTTPYAVTKPKAQMISITFAALIGLAHFVHAIPQAATTLATTGIRAVTISTSVPSPSQCLGPFLSDLAPGPAMVHRPNILSRLRKSAFVCHRNTADRSVVVATNHQPRTALLGCKDVRRQTHEQVLPTSPRRLCRVQPLQPDRGRHCQFA